MLTSAGDRIALVEFHRRSDAEYFYDRFYPDVSFPLEHSRGVDSEPITVGVSVPDNHDEVDSSRDLHRDEDGWMCIKVGTHPRTTSPTFANQPSVAWSTTLTALFALSAKPSELVSISGSSILSAPLTELCRRGLWRFRPLLDWRNGRVSPANTVPICRCPRSGRICYRGCSRQGRHEALC